MKSMLIKTCCEMFKVDPKDLLGPARFGFLMPARFAMYESLRRRGWSHARIADFMNRDRKTVSYGIERAKWHAQRNPDYEKKIDTLATLQYAVVDMGAEENHDGPKDY